MQNGYLYPAISALMAGLKAINFVEWLKYGSIRARTILSGAPLDRSAVITTANFAIDSYLFIKWGTVAWFWISEQTGDFARLATFYLIASNLFTYFYYHAWGSLYGVRQDIEALRRQFINLVLAIAFYVFAFAYLYHLPYSGDIMWGTRAPTALDAFEMSLGSATSLGGGATANTVSARLVVIYEALNTFVFVAVLLGASALKPKQSED